MAGHLFRNQVTVGSNPTFSSMGLIPQTGKGRVAGDEVSVRWQYPTYRGFESRQIHQEIR